MFENAFALLVGVDRFEDPARCALEPLDFAAADAHLLEDALLLLGYKRDNVRCLCNDRATYGAILSALNNLCSNARGDSDLVLVYFAGHGYPEERFGEGVYLVPYDATIEPFLGRCIRVRDLAEKLAKLKSGRKVLFLDSCHSGELQPELFRLEVRDFSMIAAAARDQGAIEDIEEQHGLFTLSLVEALCKLGGGAESVTIYEISSHLQRTLPGDVAGRGGRDQHPVCHNVIGKVFPLGRDISVEVHQALEGDRGIPDVVRRRAGAVLQGTV